MPALTPVGFMAFKSLLVPSTASWGVSFFAQPSMGWRTDQGYRSCVAPSRLADVSFRTLDVLLSDGA